MEGEDNTSRCTAGEQGARATGQGEKKRCREIEMVGEEQQV